MLTFEQFTDFVQELRPHLQAIVRRHIARTVVDYKADDSPVTQADREIEALIVGRIERTFPGELIVGEESGTHGTPAAGCPEWIIDPIDGTKSFIHGVPLFATLIGVMVDGRAVYGAIYNPLLDDLVVGNNEVAFWNGRPTRVRTCGSLSQASVLTTDVQNIAKYQDASGFWALVSQVRLLRTWGDAYGYFLVATGRADVMIDPIMSRWDVAALIPVIRGAGGVITDYRGGEPGAATSIVACVCPRLHAQVVGILGRGLDIPGI